MRVLITGSRDWDDKLIIDVLLKGFRELSHEVYEEQFVVIEGGADGADEHAREWGEHDEGVEHITEEAEWDLYGKRAGPIRNRVMHDKHEPDFVIALHDNLHVSKGTADMVNYAMRQGTPIYHIQRVGP